MTLWSLPPAGRFRTRMQDRQPQRLLACSQVRWRWKTYLGRAGTAKDQLESCCDECGCVANLLLSSERAVGLSRNVSRRGAVCAFSSGKSSRCQRGEFTGAPPAAWRHHLRETRSIQQSW